MKSLSTISRQRRRISRPASVKARARSVVPAAGPDDARSTLAIICRRAVRPDDGGTMARTRSSKSSAPTRFPRPTSSRPTVAANSTASWRLRQRAVPQSSERLTSISSQASSPRSGRDSRTKGRSERAVTFHSIVRGSSPAWYSRTSLYSMPAPRRLDRSSPPGWNPRRRSTGQRDRRKNSSTRRPPGTVSGGNPVPKVDPRWRKPFEHTLDDGLGRDPGRHALVSEDETVTDYLRRHLAQVVGQDMRPSPHEGERPASRHQVDRRPQAGSIGNRRCHIFEALDLPRPARVGERRGVGSHGRVDIDLGHCPLHLLQLLEGHDLSELDLRAGNPLDDDHLLLEGWVIDQHLQHEAVELGLRQRVGAVGLDRILGREHDKGRRKLMGVFADGDLAFLHRLEQRGLHLGGRAVDLVGQEQVAEYRAEL